MFLCAWHTLKGGMESDGNMCRDAARGQNSCQAAVNARPRRLTVCRPYAGCRSRRWWRTRVMRPCGTQRAQPATAWTSLSPGSRAPRRRPAPPRGRRPQKRPSGKAQRLSGLQLASAQKSGLHFTGSLVEGSGSLVCLSSAQRCTMRMGARHWEHTSRRRPSTDDSLQPEQQASHEAAGI